MSTGDEPLGRRPSNSDFDELLGILDLNQITDDTFVGSHPSKNPMRTFGGQMIAQSF
ncbi:MAG: acyl-CoA thioesterase II, partial [Mycobacterium sp.]|nr:acyl-CoA thioesterase II [Mycobacterium sp.]